MINTQKQVIGILFEVIKRFKANNDLDEEYFQIVASKKTESNKNRLTVILDERKETSKIVSKLLKKHEV